MAKKKVLIMSASIGTGHTQAAHAIEEYLNRLPEKCDVEQFDFISNDVLSLDNIVKETYLKILDLFPMVYDLMYYSSQGFKKGMVVKTLFSWGLKRRMLRVLADKNPDLIIFTHPFPAGAAALLKRQHRLDIPLIGVITDFAIHPLWVYPQIDTYFIAASPLKEELMRQHVSEDRIIVSGIPVRDVFHQHRWHWDETIHGRKNVLIMGGGLGMGSMKEALIELDRLNSVDDFTVVTGYNADLYDELCRVRQDLRHPVEILGYTNHIPELMVRSSLLVTKPGALTCTEAATVQVPTVLYSPIPGQEEANASYMQQKGCACWVKDRHDLSHVVDTLLVSPERLQAMSSASLACHRDGAEIIGRHVLKLLQHQGEQTASPLHEQCSHA